jgi:hypothetical protein
MRPRSCVSTIGPIQVRHAELHNLIYINFFLPTLRFGDFRSSSVARPAPVSLKRLPNSLTTQMPRNQYSPVKMCQKHSFPRTRHTR